MGFLGRAILLQQNPKCSGGICRAGDAGAKGHRAQASAVGAPGPSPPGSSEGPAEQGCASGAADAGDEPPPGRAVCRQHSRQSTDTFCRLLVLLHIYQPDLHGPLHKPLCRSCEVSLSKTI